MNITVNRNHVWRLLVHLAPICRSRPHRVSQWHTESILARAFQMRSHNILVWLRIPTHVYSEMTTRRCRLEWPLFCPIFRTICDTIPFVPRRLDSLDISLRIMFRYFDGNFVLYAARNVVHMFVNNIVVTLSTTLRPDFTVWCTYLFLLTLYLHSCSKRTNVVAVCS